jgi:flavodoxin
MKALVVYESMFGNTASIARAVADGINAHADVTLADASTMPDATGMDLVVVGGPTHAFGMSRPSTRQDASRQGQTRPGTVTIGMREWLDRSPTLTGVAAAAFDTKIDKPFVPGSAAHTAHRRLRRLGGRPVVPAESFRVTDTTGPLVAGELERARRWGETVAKAVQAAGHAAV